MSRSNPWKQKTRQTRHTTLIVVEGDTELALVKHLRALCGRNCGTRVTIENAHGGGGDSVLKKAIQLGKDFDACACLYDMDRAPSQKGLMCKADRMGITEIQSTPCIEALLLEVLNQPIPEDTELCKRAMQRIIGTAPLTSVDTFEQHFELDLLERQRDSITSLDQLLRMIKPT